MPDWRNFQYREFWDQPRILYTSDGERFFLLSCPFDDQADSYPDTFDVYLMPELVRSDLAGSWVGLEQKALRPLGRIRVPLSALDESRRAQIDLEVLNQLTPAPDS